MALNDKPINFDINRNNLFNLTAKQYDTDGARSFTFRLLNDSRPFSLEGLSVKVGGKKPDGNDILNDCTIKDAKKGIVELELTTQMQVASGMLNLELIILKGETRLSTVPFEIQVIKSATDFKEIQSSDEFGALNNALSKANEYSEKLKEGTEKIELQYANKLNEIDLQLSKKTNISNERLDVINDKNFEFGALNIANFAMQGQPLAPLGFIFHHYTDGNVMQIDNVGQWNTILTLKNANNPVRRADKPPTFCGSGVFMRMKDTYPTMDTVIERDVIAVLEKGELMAYSFPSKFLNNSDDIGEYVYQYATEKKHRNLWQLKNKDKAVLGISHDYEGNILIFDIPEMVEAVTWNLRRLNLNAPIVMANNTELTLKHATLNKCLTLGRTEASEVPNNSLFVDSSDSTLKFKDQIGSIHNLF